MSLGGRYVIDRVKRSIGSYLRFPVPPYNDPNFWEGVYKKMENTKKDVAVFEWGNFDCEDLLEYSCRQQHHDMRQLLLRAKQNDWESTALNSRKLPLIQTGLGEAIGVPPVSEEEKQSNKQAEENPILMLGCGSSRMGVDMLEMGWVGPIIHLDVSSRLIHDLGRQYKEPVDNTETTTTQLNIQFVHDDATFLSAIDDASVAAVIDKGLLDALFCTEDYAMCHDVLRSANRVVQPGGVVCCFSFSRPEFLLHQLLVQPTPRKNEMVRIGGRNHEQQLLKEWSGVQVQRLGFIYLYRFVKAIPQRVNLRRPVKRSKQSHRKKARLG